MGRCGLDQLTGFEETRARSDHDYLHRPFVWSHRRSGSPADSSHYGAVATLLLSHAEGPRAAAGDTTFASQTNQSTSTLRVSPPPAREPTGHVNVTAKPTTTLTVR